MTRVRFTADFDYKPTKQTTVAYKAGMELTVKKECADQAILGSMAILLEQPKTSRKRSERGV